MAAAAQQTVTGTRPLLSAASLVPEALMADVARGDRDAFSRVYSAFAPRVKAFLMRGGLSSAEAEDLAQETMVRVWRKAPLFDPAKASVGAWIFAIARNLRIDHLRRGSRLVTGAEEKEEADLSPLADETVDRTSREVRIRAIFASLPPNQHQVVALHFYEDEPHSAIAKRLGLPLGTVKSRLRLAFARIRRELEELR
jgi:RNA polymerase sigma-70 factor (ECF subfamily)